MKITYNWLKDFLKTEASPQQIADAFNRIGHEVEGVEQTGQHFDKVVVGDVLATKKHPQADKLNLCTVGVGEGEPRQIVCGAPNVRAGLKVAVALEGAVLPGEFKIKKSKIRGETSLGMICSIRELGMGDEHEGIWELDTQVDAGTPLNDILPKGDTVYDLGLTPNRGDAFSVVGLARDLAAGGVGQFNEEWSQRFIERQKSVSEDAGKDGGITPELKTEKCQYFAGLSVTGLDNTATTPEYIRERLTASGLRPINPAVDVSQYVMLTLGQPLHFYDGDKLQKPLIVCEAKGGEKLEALDDQTYTLNKGDVVIEDGSGVIGLAGVVGGITTSSEPETTHVFIEAAQFDRSQIARTGQALQVHSDARTRFERGIDPSKTRQAAIVAAQLLQEICGGNVSRVVEVGQQNPSPITIKFDPASVKTFGGLDLPPQESKKILENLGFSVVGKDVFEVTVPPHLTMHETPEDLIEDILRIKGYDHVPAILPVQNLNRIHDAAPEAAVQAAARRHLAVSGFYEANTYSFISEKAAKLFGGGDVQLKLENPIDSEGMSHMRPSLLPGLLAATARNVSRGEACVTLGEVGTVFTAQQNKNSGSDHTEGQNVAALRVGAPPRNPHQKAEKPDVFTLKADVLSLLEALGHDLSRIMIKQEAPEWFHPGRSGALVVQGRNVGHFGEVHPQVLKSFGLKSRVCAYEVNLSLLATMKLKPQAFAMSTYQAVQRDFAFVIDNNVPAEKLVTVIRKAEKGLLKDVRLFDVYEGENLPEGKKSLALSVTLQADDRTLSESEIAKISEEIVQAAQKQLQAEIRA